MIGAGVQTAELTDREEGEAKTEGCTKDVRQKHDHREKRDR